METLTQDLSQSITYLTERFSIVKSLYSSYIHEVLLLHDHLLDRHIVGKRLKSEYDSLENRRRLRDEFKQIISLNHSGIIRGYEFYQLNQLSFYTIEYIEEQFDCKQIALYLEQIIDIFKYLHQKRVIHQDIKTNNFLYQKEKLYLIDFSMAQKATPKEIEKEVLTLGRYLIAWLNQNLKISMIDQPRQAKKVISKRVYDLLINIFNGKIKRL